MFPSTSIANKALTHSPKIVVSKTKFLCHLLYYYIGEKAFHFLHNSLLNTTYMRAFKTLSIICTEYGLIGAFEITETFQLSS